MLWTALKIVLFLAAVAGLTLGVEHLMHLEGGLRIAFADVEFTLGPLQMALASLALLAGLWLILKLAGLVVATLRFIQGDATALSRYLDRSRRRKGMDALTEGFLALAAGEGERALTKARKAEKLLDDQPLTRLLVAQAAAEKGNTALAEEYYKRLLEDERARFVGVQGLLGQQIAAGNTTKARKLAQAALSLRPGHGPTQDRLLTLQTGAGDWSGARHTLLESSRAGRLPKPVFQRRDAVLTLQQAQAAEDEGNVTLAQDLAIEANRASPELVPAAVMAAGALAARGKRNAAVKAIKRAWKAQPHPALAQAFAHLDPAETPARRVQRFEALLSLAPGAEAQQTRAELLIAAEDFPAARRAVGDLHETAPSQRVMTIMAAIERGEGSSEPVVRGWLARALTAPRGPQWICEACNQPHADWQALCGHCGAFDTLAWTQAAEGATPEASGAAMLPLIVGTLPAAPTPIPEAEAVEDDPDDRLPDEVAPPEPPAPVTERPAAQVIDLDQTRRMGL